MINKTRKHISPVALLAALGVVAVLAVMAAVVWLPSSAQAQSGPSNPFAPAPTTPTPGGPSNPFAPEPEPNKPPVAMAGVLSDVELLISTTSDPINVSTAFEDPDGDTLTYTVESDRPNIVAVTIIDGVVTIVTGSNRGTADITVTAADGKGGTDSVTFTVTVIEVYTLTAVPSAPGAPGTYLVAGLGPYTAKFNLGVAGSEDDVTVTVTASPNDGITIEDSDGLIGAGFKDDEERDLEGSLTVKSTDAGSRAFEIEGECLVVGAMADIVVEDKDLDVVAEGIILCKEPEPDPPGEDEITEAECYSVTGYMGDNEDEVMDQMRDDIEPHNRPAHPTNPEMGQDTIEVLNGSADVQITVTSCEAGPVYIRFLDSDGDVFGTDIDECETCEGASGRRRGRSRQPAEAGAEPGSHRYGCSHGSDVRPVQRGHARQRCGQVPGRQGWYVLPGQVPFLGSV